MTQPLRPGLEITPADAAAWLAAGRLLLDVRQPEELERASVPGATHIPMAAVLERLDELDADADTPIAVLCHHGVRSLKITLALHQLGLPGARSVAGGIDAWSALDPSIPRYTK